VRFLPAWLRFFDGQPDCAIDLELGLKLSKIWFSFAKAFERRMRQYLKHGGILVILCVPTMAAYRRETSNDLV